MGFNSCGYNNAIFTTQFPGNGFYHRKKDDDLADGWWLVVSAPLKNMSSSLGMMTFPYIMEK